MVAVISWWAPDPPASEFAVKLSVTHRENFARGGISPDVLTVKLSPPEPPPPVLCQPPPPPPPPPVLDPNMPQPQPVHSPKPHAHRPVHGPRICAHLHKGQVHLQRGHLLLRELELRHVGALVHAVVHGRHAALHLRHVLLVAVPQVRVGHGAQLQDHVHEHEVPVDVDADAVAGQVAEEQVEPQQSFEELQPGRVLSPKGTVAGFGLRSAASSTLPPPPPPPFLAGKIPMWPLMLREEVSLAHGHALLHTWHSLVPKCAKHMAFPFPSGCTIVKMRFFQILEKTVHSPLLHPNGNRPQVFKS